MSNCECPLERIGEVGNFHRKISPTCPMHGSAVPSPAGEPQIEQLLKAIQTANLNLHTSMNLEEHPKSCECYGCGLFRAYIDFILARARENVRPIVERERAAEIPSAGLMDMRLKSVLPSPASEPHVGFTTIQQYRESRWIATLTEMAEWCDGLDADVQSERLREVISFIGNPVTPPASERLDDPKTWEGIGESYEAAPPTPENAQVTIDDKQGWVYDPDAQITIVRLRAELAALQAARDSAYLAKEIGVVEHFKGSWHDDCRCDACIAVREIAQAAVAETIEMCASVADRYKFMPVDMIASQGVARAIRALSPATIQKGKP